MVTLKTLRSGPYDLGDSGSECRDSSTIKIRHLLRVRRLGFGLHSKELGLRVATLEFRGLVFRNYGLSYHQLRTRRSGRMWRSGLRGLGFGVYGVGFGVEGRRLRLAA